MNDEENIECFLGGFFFHIYIYITTLFGLIEGIRVSVIVHILRLKLLSFELQYS